MSKQEFTFDYAHYAPLDALPESDRELAARAADACGTAYAPYSGFRVGAAALLEDGTILTASNQESEVFPSGMHIRSSAHPNQRFTARSIWCLPSAPGNLCTSNPAARRFSLTIPFAE